MKIPHFLYFMTFFAILLTVSKYKNADFSIQMREITAKTLFFDIQGIAPRCLSFFLHPHLFTPGDKNRKK